MEWELILEDLLPSHNFRRSGEIMSFERRNADMGYVLSGVGSLALTRKHWCFQLFSFHLES